MLNRSNESLYYIDRAIELNPHDSSYWVLKDIALSGIGSQEEVIMATELNPQLAPAWYNKSNELKLLGRAMMRGGL
jgi:tetratricopeptide (TPR) repeat protein